jgi:hypothetical protein
MKRKCDKCRRRLMFREYDGSRHTLCAMLRMEGFTMRRKDIGLVSECKCGWVYVDNISGDYYGSREE